MEALMDNQGLVHIGERILKYLDFKTQINCRLVRKSWNQILEKEASKTKTDLDNLLKSMKESLLKRDVYNKSVEFWRDFAMEISSKINNHVINIFIKEHISYQFNVGFSSLPLEHFVLKRDVELINATLKLKFYVGFDEALQKAIQNRYTVIVQCFKPFMTLQHKRKYVFEPTRSGNIDALKIVYPNPKEYLNIDGFGNNPIHIAAQIGHTSIVKYFIENLEELMAQNYAGHTPLYYAIVCCKPTIIGHLLKVVPEDHILKPIMNGKNVIHIAAERGQFEDVYQLCKKLKNPIVPDDKGNTPIHYAAYIGHLEMLKFLIPYSKDLMIPNKYGKTPLQAAAVNGHSKAANYLVECEHTQNQRMKIPSRQFVCSIL